MVICAMCHMAVSDDFVNWTEPVPLKYSDKVDREMYTNGVLPYERAPHILIAFPTEYTDRFAVAQVHPILMTSRDGGYSFLRRREPLIPCSAPQQRDGNRANYLAHGLVRGNEGEYFVYATEGTDMRKATRCRSGRRSHSCRGSGSGVLRSVSTDSFPSDPVRDGGTIVTKPFVLNGSQLELNYIAWPRPAGEIRVEIQDANGEPLKGPNAERLQATAG